MSLIGLSTHLVMADIRNERAAQEAKWGEQNHENGTGSEVDVESLAEFREHMTLLEKLGHVTWREILVEEVKEVLVETDLPKLRAELVQVAAVAVNWIECIDRRAKCSTCHQDYDTPGCSVGANGESTHTVYGGISNAQTP